MQNQDDQQTFNEETSVDENVTASLGEENADAGQDSTTSFDESQSQNETDETLKIDPQNLKAERAKWAKLESENARLKQEEILAKSFRESLKDKGTYDAYRQYLKTSTGEDIGTYESRFQGNQAQNENKPPSPEQVAQYAVQTVESKRMLDDFIKKHPEMDPRKANEDQKTVLGKRFASITRFAEALMSEDQSLSAEEALDLGYASHPKVNAQMLKQAELKGEMTGKALANASKIGVTGNVSGANSKGPTEEAVDPVDEIVMKTLKINTPEKRQLYLKHKNNK